MNFENFTIKSREAVQKAVSLAADGGQQAVGTLHLLGGVLAVGENVTQFLFGKIGANLQQLQQVLQKRLQALPRVQGGGEPYLEREANEVLQQSQTVAKQRPKTFQPAKGVALPMETNSAGSMAYSAFRSHTV